jgi:hypothetical protein
MELATPKFVPLVTAPSLGDGWQGLFDAADGKEMNQQQSEAYTQCRFPLSEAIYYHPCCFGHPVGVCFFHAGGAVNRC